MHLSSAVIVLLGSIVSLVAADIPITGYNPGGPISFITSVTQPKPSATYLGTLPGHKVPPPSVASPAPTPCTTWINKLPSEDTDCTFREITKTITKSIDCGGCVLSTRYLGVGLPCLQQTTIRGLTVTTAETCAASPTGKSW